MSEQLVNRVLYGLQGDLDSEQLGKVKEVLQSVLCFYKIEEEKKELRVNDDRWKRDVEEYLIAKMLEGKSPGTITRYRYELCRLLSYVNLSVEDIVHEDISGYMRAYKRIRNVANQTLKNVRAVFSGFFTWLHVRGRIAVNPIALIKPVKVQQKIRKAYSDTDREMMLRSCKTIRDKAIMECFYSTAVRVSELASIDRTDIRFSAKNLVVLGKGDKERVVYLNERSHMYLKEYLDSRTDNNPALFVSEKKPHARLGKNGLEDIISRTGKRVSVHAYPHRFRRTAATNALNRGMPLQEVSKMLGHSKLDTTMTYCTVEQESVQYHHKKYLSA